MSHFSPDCAKSWRQPASLGIHNCSAGSLSQCCLASSLPLSLGRPHCQKITETSQSLSQAGFSRETRPGSQLGVTNIRVEDGCQEDCASCLVFFSFNIDHVKEFTFHGSELPSFPPFLRSSRRLLCGRQFSILLPWKRFCTSVLLEKCLGNLLPYPMSSAMNFSRMTKQVAFKSSKLQINRSSAVTDCVPC